MIRGLFCILEIKTKTMSNPLVAELLQEPHAYLIIQEIQHILEDEKARRIAFYNDITEQEK